MSVQLGGGQVTLAEDISLVEQAIAADDEARARLYRRHAPMALRVARETLGQDDDAHDVVSEAFLRVFAVLPAGRLENPAAFRSYLLVTTRNLAVSARRRRRRCQPVADHGAEPATHAPGPVERLLDDEDSSLVARAFRDLPERWRSVLWLTEIEGIPPREAGLLLGLSANGTAQLAVRARARLRERYLQAHLRAPVAVDCRATTEQLGAYVGGALPPRTIAKVDQHVAGCPACRSRLSELEDVGGTLRRAGLPLGLLVAGGSAGRWLPRVAQAVSRGWSGRGAGRRAGRRALDWASTATASKVAAAGVAAMLAASGAGAAAVAYGSRPLPTGTAVVSVPSAAVPSLEAEVVPTTPAVGRATSTADAVPHANTASVAGEAEPAPQPDGLAPALIVLAAADCLRSQLADPVEQDVASAEGMTAATACESTATAALLDAVPGLPLAEMATSVLEALVADAHAGNLPTLAPADVIAAVQAADPELLPLLDTAIDGSTEGQGPSVLDVLVVLLANPLAS